MAQKREKEETELKVPETTLTMCSPSIPSATSKVSGSDEHRSSSSPSPSPDRPDLKTGAVVDSRLSSASSPSIPPNVSGSDKHRSSSSSSPDRSDLKTGAVVDSRSSSASSPELSKRSERLDLHQKARSPTVESVEDDSNKVKTREVNRCSGCRRKVGLMGFRCRCGEMFCSDHRYSDRHDCSYDYKAAGREAIARENPVVRASKILKV